MRVFIALVLMLPIRLLAEDMPTMKLVSYEHGVATVSISNPTSASIYLPERPGRCHGCLEILNEGHWIPIVGTVDDVNTVIEIPAGESKTFAVPVRLLIRRETSVTFRIFAIYMRKPKIEKDTRIFSIVCEPTKS